MRRPVAWLAGVLALAAASVMVSAQAPGKPVTGNPTPGVAQPDPPNLADRVTFTGCLRPVARAAAATDGNTPSNARFELTSAERVDRVPAGTGGSPATTGVSSKTYRLEGIESQFSPFVGAKVEISGEVKPPSAAEKTAPPTLVVEFMRRIAATCP